MPENYKIRSVRVEDYFQWNNLLIAAMMLKGLKYIMKEHPVSTLKKKKEERLLKTEEDITEESSEKIPSSKFSEDNEKLFSYRMLFIDFQTGKNFPRMQQGWLSSVDVAKV